MQTAFQLFIFLFLHTAHHLTFSTVSSCRGAASNELWILFSPAFRQFLLRNTLHNKINTLRSCIDPVIPLLPTSQQKPHPAMPLFQELPPSLRLLPAWSVTSDASHFYKDSTQSPTAMLWHGHHLTKAAVAASPAKKRPASHLPHPSDFSSVCSIYDIPYRHAVHKTSQTRPCPAAREYPLSSTFRHIIRWHAVAHAFDRYTPATQRIPFSSYRIFLDVICI